MKKYVLMLILSKDMKEVLLMKRNKEPYKGLLNGIGGKFLPNEEPFNAVYRECFEEIGEENIPPTMHMLLTIHFPKSQVMLYVFYTFTEKFIPKHCDEGELDWYDINIIKDVNNEDVAGDGNVAYFLKFIENIYKGVQ